MQGELPTWFWAAFPFLWLGMWLLVTTVLGALSGWFSLQEEFPDTRDPALVTLRMQSVSMGIGVSMSGVLTLSATRSGLRVGIWRIFGPFQRPFLVPWNHIRAEPRTMLFAPYVRLRFGDPQEGTLTLAPRSWERLAAHAGRAPVARAVAPVSRRRNAMGFVIQWLAVTAVASAFFYFGSRRNFAPGLPLAMCIGFPALVFGFGQFIRYLREG